MQSQAKVLASRQRGVKGNLYVADCPSRSVLDHVTSRLGALVLLVLLDGTRRFSELARGIGGVSEKMLAQTLRALEADGLLLRTCPETKVIVAGAGARMRCGSWFRRRCGEVRSLC